MRYLKTPDGPMIEGASAAMLVDLLAEFDSVAARAGRPLDAVTLPGLEPDAIRRRLRDEGLSAPEEIVRWFAWRNGAAVPILAYPNFPPASLDLAIDKMHSFAAFAASPDPAESADVGLGLGWLPLEVSNHGIAALCDHDSDAPVLLHYSDWGYWDTPARDSGLFRAVSLCTIVSWWIEGIESGATWWNADQNRWESDYSRLPESQQAVRM